MLGYASGNERMVVGFRIHKNCRPNSLPVNEARSFGWKTYWHRPRLGAFIIFFEELLDDVFPLCSPLTAVFCGVIKVFIARYSKNTAVLQLFSERNDIIIKEHQLALVPT
jgi:hypothetical protein